MLNPTSPAHSLQWFALDRLFMRFVVSLCDLKIIENVCVFDFVFTFCFATDSNKSNRVSEKITTLNFGKESVRSSFGVRSGSVRGSFRGSFGPISDQNVWSRKFKISKVFKLCGRRRSGGDPPGGGARDGG